MNELIESRDFFLFTEPISLRLGVDEIEIILKQKRYWKESGSGALFGFYNKKRNRILVYFRDGYPWILKGHENRGEFVTWMWNKNRIRNGFIRLTQRETRRLLRI